MSQVDIRQHGYSTASPKDIPASPAAPIQEMKKIEKPAETKEKEGPQSGTPGSDAIIDTVKLISGNKSDQKTA